MSQSDRESKSCQKRETNAQNNELWAKNYINCLVEKNKIKNIAVFQTSDTR